MPDVRRVPAGPLEIAFVESGDGEPLVMCHGNEADRRQYDALRRLLAPGIRAISYDQRDTGDTTGFTGDYTMADLGRDCVAFIEALGLASAHVAGTSFGGMVAMQAALARPERVRSLTLISTAPARAMFSAAADGIAAMSPTERSAFMLDAILTPEGRAAHPELVTEAAALLTGRTPEQSGRRFAAMQSRRLHRSGSPRSRRRHWCCTAPTTPSSRWPRPSGSPAASPAPPSACWTGCATASPSSGVSTRPGS